MMQFIYYLCMKSIDKNHTNKQKSKKCLFYINKIYIFT